ncbi:enoyl-CoA delta isomerase 2-like isoform X2 [Oscarella lobularis]|uniref:enoyl-CoA delta isomerase 2-like isoform X2 n=1 Tax=Oscarella lobularis TaxID=121494 RepID=UPI0033144964
MTTKDGVLSIALNRPKKLNSLTLQMYRDITSALARAGSDDAVRVCTLTAHGDYYSSGNDLNSFMNVTPGGVERIAREGEEILHAFVDSFIKFPKPLVAIVNGPAFGIMVTTLALADLVFSSDKATFYTPFAETAQSPEGCSSLLFPMIIGPAKASEILLLSHKLTAKEVFDRNLVTAVYPHDQFREEADKCVQKLVASPPKLASSNISISD